MTSAGHREDSRRWKPAQFHHYLTLGELARLVKRDVSRLKQCEKAGQIAAPIRVKVGRHQVRLYSPSEVSAIVRHFENVKPGRPRRKK